MPISAEAREKIATAARKRWQKVLEKEKKTSVAPAAKSATNGARKPSLAPEAYLRAEWAAHGLRTSPETKPTAKRSSKAKGNRIEDEHEHDGRGRSATAPDPQSAIRNPQSAEGVQMFDPETIRRSPFNRDFFDQEKLAELTANIKIHGVLQNGVVRPVEPPEGKIAWEIIAGERRWLGAKAAKCLYPATVRPATDTEVLELQAIENMLREDLNPLDEAHKFDQLRTAYESAGLNATLAIDKISAKTGKAASTIFERLTLLKLPGAVQSLLQRGELPASHAGLLTKLKSSASQAAIAAQIVRPKKGDPANLEKVPDSAPILSYRAAKDLVETARQREVNDAEFERAKAAFAGRVLDKKETNTIIRFNSWGGWGFKAEGYVLGETSCQLKGANYRAYDKLWKKAPAGLLFQDEEGKPVVIFHKADADTAVKDGGKLQKEASRAKPPREKDPATLQREERFRARKEEWDRVVPALVGKFTNGAENCRMWTFFAGALMRTLDTDALLERRGWKQDDVMLDLPKMGVGELRGICAELLLQEDQPYLWYNPDKRWGDTLTAAAALFGVPLQTPGTEGNDETRMTNDDAKI